MINVTKIISRGLSYNILSNIKYSDIGYNMINNFKEVKDHVVIDYNEGVSFIKDVKNVEEIDFNNI